MESNDIRKEFNPITITSMNKEQLHAETSKHKYHNQTGYIALGTQDTDPRSALDLRFDCMVANSLFPAKGDAHKQYGKGCNRSTA